jgi:hypothetical protein
MSAAFMQLQNEYDWTARAFYSYLRHRSTHRLSRNALSTDIGSSYAKATAAKSWPPTFHGTEVQNAWGITSTPRIRQVCKSRCCTVPHFHDIMPVCSIRSDRNEDACNVLTAARNPDARSGGGI